VSTTFELVAVGVAGLIGGFINTLAGGGSIVMVPAMMMVGLPAGIANATSRVPIFAQCLTSTVTFARAKRLEKKPTLDVTPLAIVGAIAGAWIETLLPDRFYRPFLLVTMIAMALLLLVRAETLAPPPGTEPRRVLGSPVPMLLTLAAGFFGGLIQAGAGFVLLALFAGALRYDLVRSNALKAVVMLAYIAVTVVIFALRGRVVWEIAGAMTVGSVIGAWIGARTAIARDSGWIRWLIVAMVIAMCVWIAIRS
jgi:uncharacterized membrane protein YfcA